MLHFHERVEYLTRYGSRSNRVGLLRTGSDISGTFRSVASHSLFLSSTIKAQTSCVKMSFFFRFHTHIIYTHFFSTLQLRIYTLYTLIYIYTQILKRILTLIFVNLVFNFFLHFQSICIWRPK